MMLTYINSFKFNKKKSIIFNLYNILSFSLVLILFLKNRNKGQGYLFFFPYLIFKTTK